MLLGALLAAALVAAGCGGSSGSGGSGGSSSSSTGGDGEPQTGGTLNELWTDDVDFIDPGQTYYQMGFQIAGATQSALYWYKPDDGVHASPLLATSAPKITDDGKRVEVTIRSGVKFSPPVNREVTSKDVKYAIERGFFNTVNNGYAGAYFGDVKGAKVGAKPGTTIPGIETPDDTTIVFHLTRATGGVLAGALALPLSAPVPEEYAAKFDKENPSTYGNNQVSTGPYMIQNDSSGKAIGYDPGKKIDLVRNPNWDKSGDWRPAYLDAINIPEGNDDTTVASSKILEGTGMANGDFSPPPSILKEATTRFKDQLVLTPTGGARWIALNTKIKPFDDLNVRRAVLAGFDRNAARLARGGALLGDMPTHFIPPGVPGFEESGGVKGPGFDFMNSTGEPNQQVSGEYFKKAGYSSGKYEGNDEILMVGTSEGVAQKVAEIAKQNLENMGFNVRLRLVTQDAMYTKFCNVPGANVAICPNVGWLKDFSDPQTMLDPTFNGKNILPQNNSNWSQLDVPKINQAMADAEIISDPADRAKAWAEIDKMVTEQAPAVSFVWDKNANITSPDVNGVVNQFNAQFDLSFTSLKK